MHSGHLLEQKNKLLSLLSSVGSFCVAYVLFMLLLFRMSVRYIISLCGFSWEAGTACKLDI